MIVHRDCFLNKGDKNEKGVFVTGFLMSGPDEAFPFETHAVFEVVGRSSVLASRPRSSQLPFVELRSGVGSSPT